MKFFIDVEERAIASNSAAVLTTLMVRNIVKKISTEGLFPCGVVEPQATRQDVEGAVNEGAKTQVVLMTCSCSCARSSSRTFRRCIWKKSTKVLTGAMNQKNYDDFAGDDVNHCKLDPARVREERKAETEYFQKMQVYKEVLGQEVHGCDSDDADQGAETHRQQSRNSKIKNGENRAHHGKRRCTSVFQRTQHVASVFGAK